MPDQAYVVMATQGKRDDYDVWAVAVYADEKLAKKHAEAAESWASEYAGRVKRLVPVERILPEIDYWIINQTDSAWEQSPFDPHLQVISSHEVPEYHVEPVPLRTALPVVEGGGETA